jgi:hypothetical protein
MYTFLIFIFFKCLSFLESKNWVFKPGAGGSRQDSERSRLDGAAWPAGLGAGRAGLVAVSKAFTRYNF